MAKLIGVIICFFFIKIAGDIPDIPNWAWFIGISVMLAGFMAGGDN